MLAKTEGIIIRSLKYGESSLILDIYTRDYGLRSYIIGGVRKTKSKTNIGSLQLMSIVEILAYHKDENKLSRIKELQGIHHYKSIPFEVLKSSVGLFIIELIKNSIRENEENQELYQFINDWYVFLDNTKHSIANLHLLFMLEFSSYIGIQPRDNYGMNRTIFDLKDGQFISEYPDHPYYIDPTCAETLYDLMMEERNTVSNLKIKNQHRRELLEKLMLFYKLHIESFKEMRTYQILNEILT